MIMGLYSSANLNVDLFILVETLQLKVQRLQAVPYPCTTHKIEAFIQ